MIPFLTFLLGAAAGVIGGYWLGERRAKLAAAEDREVLKSRAEAAEKALETNQRTHAGQVKHAFDSAALIMVESRNVMKTSQVAMAEAVDLTKKAAGMILPPEVEGDMTATSVADADRIKARAQRAEYEAEERRRRG